MFLAQMYIVPFLVVPFLLSSFGTFFGGYLIILWGLAGPPNEAS